MLVLRPSSSTSLRTALLTLCALVTACSNTAPRDGDAATPDAAADAALPDASLLDGAVSDGAASDAATADVGTDAATDASGGETRYTLQQGECFTLATATVTSTALPDGGFDRCGDFDLEGPSSPYLVGIDGTLCPLDGMTFATLGEIPTMPMFCGRVINLTARNMGFIVRIDATHTYRVHVLETMPAMVFSFDQVP